MPKIKRCHEEWAKSFGDGHEEYFFDCPGCGAMHRAIVKWGATAGRTEPAWTFNGNLDRPTFSPSFRHGTGSRQCHYFIREGRIEFCADSSHALAGQTVEMPEVD